MKGLAGAGSILLAEIAGYLAYIMPESVLDSLPCAASAFYCAAVILLLLAAISLLSWSVSRNEGKQ
jgi:hypothetical protein